MALLFDLFRDETREPYGRADIETNTYITGRMGEHDVILAVLPSRGTSSVAVAAVSL